MGKHTKVIKGKTAWVIAEPMTKKLPNNSGFVEDGFVARFGLEEQTEELFGQFVRNGQSVVKFDTEPDAAYAGFIEIEKQLL